MRLIPQYDTNSDIRIHYNTIDAARINRGTAPRPGESTSTMQAIEHTSTTAVTPAPESVAAELMTAGDGWARCFSCGDAWAIRVEDHPDAFRPRGDVAGAAAQRPQNRPRRDEQQQHDTEHIVHDLDALQAGLERAIAGAMDALPSSPGAAYLEARGISLDVALKLGIGWGTRGALAGRVVFPLCGPDGHPTSAIGRRIHETDDRRNPKYKALDGEAGYIKTLFNGGAVAYARCTGHPLIVVEGPLDAAACIAAGLPLTVAIGSTSYAHPEHFAGLVTVILALDGDDAGQAGRRDLWLALTARGAVASASPLWRIKCSSRN